MAYLYIAEYATLGRDVKGIGLQAAEEGSLLAEQKIANDGASTQSAAFNSETKFVRLHTDSVCSIKYGENPTATTAHKRMAADATEYFAVKGGQKIAAIANT